MALQLHLHLLDVVGLLGLVAGDVAQELVHLVVVGAVVGVGTFCFLQGLRSVGKISSASVPSHLLCLLQTPPNPSRFPCSLKTWISARVVLLVLLLQEILIRNFSQLYPASTCQQPLPLPPQTSLEALLQLLLPRMVLRLLQFQRGSNSTANIPALQADPAPQPHLWSICLLRLWKRWLSL